MFKPGDINYETLKRALELQVNHEKIITTTMKTETFGRNHEIKVAAGVAYAGIETRILVVLKQTQTDIEVKTEIQYVENGPVEKIAITEKQTEELLRLMSTFDARLFDSKENLERLKPIKELNSLMRLEYFPLKNEIYEYKDDTSVTTEEAEEDLEVLLGLKSEINKILEDIDKNYNNTTKLHNQLYDNKKFK